MEAGDPVEDPPILPDFLHAFPGLHPEDLSQANTALYLSQTERSSALVCLRTGKEFWKQREEMSDTPPSPGSTGSLQEEEPLQDTTLGGYISHHNRPPAFEGSDGHPYTVSPEVERTPNLATPFSGFLVFPRWADTGAGIVGHLETPTLLETRTREEVQAALDTLNLGEVKRLLEEAIRRKRDEMD